MNEDPPSLPWWIRLGQFLRRHTEEAIGLAIAGGIVGAAAWTGGAIWQWLLESIRTHPGEIVCLLALGTTIYAVQKWFSWKLVAKVALDKALKFDAVEDALATEKAKSAELERAAAKAKQPEDILSAEERKIVTCILCAGELTAKELASEIGYDIGQVNAGLKRLRYEPEHQFVRRCGSTPKGEELFCLTEQGKAYADKQGIAAIEQSIAQVRQTAAEEEIESLKRQLAASQNVALEYAAQIERIKQAPHIQVSRPWMVSGGG